MRKQDYYREGYLIQRNDGQYLTSVISNGNPERPVCYWSRFPADALAFKRYTAAEMRAMQLGAKIVTFRTDDPERGHLPKRIVTGVLLV